jgi:hypothetical protein
MKIKQKNTTFEIQKMSARTGVAVSKIKILLGISLDKDEYTMSHRMSFISESEYIWRKAEYNSKAKKVELKRLAELILDATKAATTAEEAKKIYEMAPEKSYHFRLKIITLKRWEELALQESKVAITAEKAWEAYMKAPNNSEAKNIALQNWKKVVTLKEAWEAYSESMNMRRGEHINHDLNNVALARWLELAFDAIKVAITAKDVEEFYRLAPFNSELKTIARKKLEKLALKECKDTTTAEDAQKLWCIVRNHPVGHEVLKKWEKLSLQESYVAKNPKEAWKVYQEAPDDSEAKKVALNKWLEFLNTAAKLDRAYKNSRSKNFGYIGEVENAILKKLATFYGWKE